jgi:hypothetical protein
MVRNCSCSAVANLLGRPPLIPCFIGSNSNPTIPYCFKDNQRIGHASADKVKIWMWRYGRGRSRRIGSGPSGSARAGSAAHKAAAELTEHWSMIS